MEADDPGPLAVHPDPHDIAEHTKIRKREMEAITERLGRFSRLPWASVWGATSAMLLGAAIGGAIAGTQLAPEPDKTLYWCAVGIVLVLGLVCALAALSIHSERADSVKAIKEDLDKLLSGEVGADS